MKKGENVETSIFFSIKTQNYCQLMKTDLWLKKKKKPKN